MINFFLILNLFNLTSNLPQNRSFKQLSVNDGFASNYINCIYQDSRGYMWVGTNNGLNRYDGHEIQTFTHLYEDSLSLSDNHIRAVIEDTVLGNVWIATRNGLDYYDADRGVISRKTSSLVIEQGLLSNDFTDLYQDPFGGLWIGVQDGLILEVDNELKLVRPESEIIGWTFTINSISHWKGSLYFVSTSSGLYAFDKETLSFDRLFDNGVLNILKDSNGNFWFGTYEYGALFLAAKSEGRFEEFNVQNGKLKDNYVSGIVEDDQGNIWLSLRGAGVQIILANNRGSEFLFNAMDHSNDIVSNAVTNMMKDNQGNIWIGSFDAGIIFYDRHQKIFDTYHFDYQKNGFKNRHVRSLFQDSEGDVWIGTKVQGGLSSFDPETFTFKHYYPDDSKTNTINDSYVFCIEEDRPGYIWVGTLHGGLNLLNKKTGEFTYYSDDPSDPNSVTSRAIYALLKDSKGRLWVGTGWEGIDFFDSGMKKTAKYQEVLSNNSIRDIYEDSQGRIWVGTLNGLNRYVEGENKFVQYIADPKDSTTLGASNVSKILEDHSGRIWIATLGGGLCLWNDEKDNFYQYNKEDGMASDMISTMVVDEKGNLWLSTIKGLTKFNIPSGGEVPQADFRNYDSKDGFLGRELSLTTTLKLDDGGILYGASHGINIFYPDEVVDNQTFSEIHFTDFKLFNKSVAIGVEGSPLRKDINRVDEIELNHKQPIFTIEYVAINYASPEKNQYAYRLEGLEAEWNEVGNIRQATYTNLDPGHYTFHLKASNNDGMWNEVEKTLEIEILPPPWKTWWAYSMYVIVILAFLTFLRYLAIRKVKNQKGRELDQMKLKFFINVSHEFRTPLTLILSPLDKLKAATDPLEIQKSVRNIQQNTHQLLRLVNQLLDFRKAELGKLPLHALMTDVVAFSSGIVGLFDELSKDKKIELSFHAEPSQIRIWIDPGMYEKILNNLLSNAFKFCDNGDRIEVSLIVVNEYFPSRSLGLMLKPKRDKQYVRLRVKDTGRGIRKNQLKKIFNRFQSLSEQEAGTGIGLNYVKNLIELHQGQVSVNSEYGHGSVFDVWLPLGDQHLKPKEKIREEFALNDFVYSHGDVASVRYEFEASDEKWDLEEAEEGDTALINNQIILIVEDNKVLRKQIKGEFESSFAVKEAKNGLEGWRKAQEIIPDLIISDVMMPKMDGVEFCKLVKSNINTSHVPVVLLTAKGLIEHKIEGYEVGADEYMSKPFFMDELKVRVSNILENRKKLREKFSAHSLTSSFEDVTQNNKDRDFLSQVNATVIKNISNSEFTYNELYKEIGLSRTSFYRKISSLTNMSPSYFLHYTRIKYAAGLMINKELSMKEVCYRSGFNSQPYFNKTFKKVFGKTPLEYRNNPDESD